MNNQYKVTKPTYHLDKSWEYNYRHGPNFNGPYPPFPKEKKWSFLGYKLISPLGVASGPLPNSKWIIPYFKLGYGSITQKTVRSTPHKSHQVPNITIVKSGQKLGSQSNTIVVQRKINAKVENLSITNSFGNPCFTTREWQSEAKKSRKAKSDGQLFGISVYGTSEVTTTLQELAHDYAKTAKMAKVAGAQYVEANLACPNVAGAENPFLHRDANAVSQIVKMTKSQISNIPLVLKIGNYENYQNLLEVLKLAKGNFEAISAINALQRKIVDSSGKSPLPGRDASGVCGYIIKEEALKTVQMLKKAQKDLKMNFEIIGVGGIMKAKDVNEFLKAGANHVHSATAVMFNPYLNYEYLQEYN